MRLQGSDPVTLPVVWGVTVLLQEVVLDQFGHFQGDFIRFCQRRLQETRRDDFNAASAEIIH